MPEDIPKAVMVLVWLLSGTIIFGWILMKYTVLLSIIFAVVFYALPMLVYARMRKNKYRLITKI